MAMCVSVSLSLCTVSERTVCVSLSLCTVSERAVGVSVSLSLCTVSERTVGEPWSDSRPIRELLLRCCDGRGSREGNSSEVRRYRKDWWEAEIQTKVTDLFSTYLAKLRIVFIVEETMLYIAPM